jgi:Hint domain
MTEFTGTYGFMYYVQLKAGNYYLVNDASGPEQVNPIQTGVTVTAPTQSVADGSTFTINGFPGTFTLESAAYETTFGPQEGFIVYNSATKGYYFITNQEFTGASNQIASQLIGENSDAMTICFLAGTAIDTPSGGVAVEDLKRGDLVLTSDGRSIPIRWIGRQTVSRRFADPLRVLPIRVKAGALGENVPSRDLLVSPDHALFVDGLLIHAAALVNGTSIVREDKVPVTFMYYHVEVDDHSLILAENTPAETFIDNVDRMHFDNWDEHEALYADGKAIAEMPYPRAKACRQVPRAMRDRLEVRGNALYAKGISSAA